VRRIAHSFATARLSIYSASDAVAMLAKPVAGYRLVRKLGQGSRAEVFLGHAGPESTRTAAVKTYYPATTAESIDAEVRALSSAGHAHTVQLRDLSTGEDGRPVLVFERLELGSLAQLLVSRSSLAAGEAVTILAPLAAAVGSVHESGVVHGAISATRVLFRESGAPVLCSFGHATFGAEGIEGDNRALAAVARAVLDRVPEAEKLRAWLDTLIGHPPGFSARLSERVFDFAAAEPVRFSAETSSAERIPARTLGVRPAIEPIATEHVAIEPVVIAPKGLRARLLALIEPYLARIPHGLRKPRYLAMAAGAVTLVVAIGVVPSGRSTPTAPVPPLVPTSSAAGPVLDDDPVAAFAVLVESRNRCIRDLSVLCLDAVVQQGSAAMDDDIALIRSIENGDGGAAALEARGAVLVERMGDAALVRYESGPESEPASALLVKGEAGWRIRSYVPG
jgi:tRNA A-37 threonylcarbamoyl transferase component Bud32